MTTLFQFLGDRTSLLNGFRVKPVAIGAVLKKARSVRVVEARQGDDGIVLGKKLYTSLASKASAMSCRCFSTGLGLGKDFIWETLER